MKEQKVLAVAKYIIENKATIAVTAKKFDLSISSVKKYINQELPLIDIDIYEAVKKTQNELIGIGQMVGGTNGKRGPKYSDFEALELAEVMIASSMTLDEASEHFKIPRSTIYDKIRSIKDDKIQAELDNLFMCSKKAKH